ncbi:MAG: hypothetical protein AAB539_03650 [Patescibacteria group bacterium]
MIFTNRVKEEVMRENRVKGKMLELVAVVGVMIGVFFVARYKIFGRDTRVSQGPVTEVVAEAESVSSMPRAVWEFEKLALDPKALRLFTLPDGRLAGPMFAADDPMDGVDAWIGLGGMDFYALVARWEASDKTAPLFARPEEKGKRDFSALYWLQRDYAPVYYFQNAENLARGMEMLARGELILAYGCWCAAGVEDASPAGPHYSGVRAVVYRIERQRAPDGRVVSVMYCNHYTKALVKSDQAGRDAALVHYQGIGSDTITSVEMRGAGVPVFLIDELIYMLAKKGVHWRIPAPRG